MALSQNDIRSAAERLDHAEKTRKQIRQISLEHPGITIKDAYAIQKAWVEMKIAQGRVVKDYSDTGMTAYLEFEMPAGAEYFTLEVNNNRIHQGLSDNAKVPPPEMAS